MLDVIIHTLIGGLIGVLINFLADLLPRTRMITDISCSNCSKPFRPIDVVIRSKCKQCGTQTAAGIKSSLWSRVFALECPHCLHTYSLKGYLFSFQCGSCGRKPVFRNWLVLIFTIAAFILVGIYPMGGLNFWATIPILLFFGVILVIDIEHHVILFETSLLGFVLLFFYGNYMQNFSLQGLIMTSLGGISAFIIMLIIYFFGIFFSRLMSKSRKEEASEPGLGFGDVYAAAFLGFFVGWPYSFGMIIIAILLSGIYSFFYLAIKAVMKKYQVYATIPYAPFLVLAAVSIFYLPPIPNL